MPRGLSVRDRMRRKLRTKPGRKRYAQRMETVEPVFGQMKQGRGFRQFLLRGLEKVNWEWLLICTGRNLLHLFRSGGESPARRFTSHLGKMASAIGASSTGKRSRHSLGSATIVVAS